MMSKTGIHLHKNYVRVDNLTYMAYVACTLFSMSNTLLYTCYENNLVLLTLYPLSRKNLSQPTFSCNYIGKAWTRCHLLEYRVWIKMYKTMHNHFWDWEKLSKNSWFNYFLITEMCLLLVDIEVIWWWWLYVKVM